MWCVVATALLFPPLMYVVFNYIRFLFDGRNYPPGPIPLPVIGNAHLLSRELHLVLFELAKKYGDVMTFCIGMQRFVIVNSYDGLKEMLVKKGTTFGGRPRLSGKTNRNFTSLTALHHGSLHKTIKKLSYMSIKSYSDFSTRSEDAIAEECKYLKEKLLKKIGTFDGLQKDVGLSVLNVICTLLFSKRYNEDDEEFENILKFSNLIIRNSVLTSTTIVIPWLRYLLPRRYNEAEEAVKIRDPILSKHLTYHKKTFDKKNIRDIIDAMIMHLAENSHKPECKNIIDDHLEMLLNDFIIAGSETTTSSIVWMIMYLMHWPKYQDEIYNEMVSVVGEERYPTSADRSSLHLMQAAIRETLRISSVAALGIPHSALEGGSICGNSIPKDAIVFTNLWRMHHDSNVWENPFEFNPCRWLNDDGNFQVKLPNGFLPFSAGPRVCLGESLAKEELFIFCSRLLKDFRFEVPKGGELPSLEGKLGVTLIPMDFKIKLSVRKNH